MPPSRTSRRYQLARHPQSRRSRLLRLLMPMLHRRLMITQRRSRPRTRGPSQAVPEPPPRRAPPLHRHAPSYPLFRPSPKAARRLPRQAPKRPPRLPKHLLPRTRRARYLPSVSRPRRKPNSRVRRLPSLPHAHHRQAGVPCSQKMLLPQQLPRTGTLRTAQPVKGPTVLLLTMRTGHSTLPSLLTTA